MRRLCRLGVFGGAEGPLAVQPPQLTVRRAAVRPRSRLGFAIPAERRISVTAYPGIRPGDALEVLLHELVHIFVGGASRGRRWHGPQFTQTLGRAMREAYGLRGVKPRNARHGSYAEALERLAADRERVQLELAL
jgi:hypothetical protein